MSKQPNKNSTRDIMIIIGSAILVVGAIIGFIQLGSDSEEDAIDEAQPTATITRPEAAEQLQALLAQQGVIIENIVIGDAVLSVTFDMSSDVDAAGRTFVFGLGMLETYDYSSELIELLFTDERWAASVADLKLAEEGNATLDEIVTITPIVSD